MLQEFWIRSPSYQSGRGDPECQGPMARPYHFVFQHPPPLHLPSASRQVSTLYVETNVSIGHMKPRIPCWSLTFYTLIIIWLMSREATNPLPKLPGTLLPPSLPWFSSQHLAASEKPHLYLSHYFSPGGHTVGKDLPVFHTVVDQTLKRVHSKS